MLGFTSLTSIVHFTVMSYLLLSVLFIILFILYFHSSVVICIHVLCTCTLPSFYTLIRLLSDDPEFAHPDIRCFVLLIRCWWDRTLCEEYRVFLCCLTVFLSLLYSYFFLILYILDSVSIFSCIYLLSCVDIYMCYCSNRNLLQWIFVAWFMLLKT